MRLFPHLPTLAIGALLIVPTLACTLNFQRTIDDVLRDAQQEQRPAILIFTGSDWNERSSILHNNVLQEPEFSDWLNPHFTLLQADYPQRFALPPESAEHNIALAERYKVRALPTILAINPDGTEFARLEYHDESAAEMLALIRKWRTKFDDSRQATIVGAR